MKQKSIFKIVSYGFLVLSYLAFVLCWIYILQTRIQLDGQAITLQKADRMREFSILADISEKAIYIIFLMNACHAWVTGKKKLSLLVRRELTAVVLLSLTCVAVVGIYQIIVSPAEIVMNFFEPLFVCAALTIFSFLAFVVFKLAR